MKVGITGHRNLAKTEAEWLNKELKVEIDQMNIDEAYSSLSVGADQIFAKIIVTKKIPLIAVIPSKKYEETFKADEIEAYKKILSLSQKNIQLDFDEPSDKAFYEAGKFLVNSTDVLFACWNSLPAKGLGGTADIVAYAKKNNKKIIHLNPSTKTKNYINYG